MKHEDIRNVSCLKCSLSPECRMMKAEVCIIGEGNLQADLMVIAEAPDREDAMAGTVMQSKKDSLFDKIVTEVIDGDLRRIYKTYLVKCKVDGVASEASIKACWDYLEQEIKLVKPKAILTLGEAPLNAILKAKKVANVRGNMFITEIAGMQIKVIPTYSCGFVSKVQSKLKDFASDIYKAYNEGTGLIKGLRRSEYKLLTDIENIEAMVAEVKLAKTMCFDFETHNTEWHNKLDGNKATMLSISINPGFSYCIPLDHFDSPFSHTEVIEILHYLGRELLSDPDIRKIGHNLKFDLHIFAMYGVTDLHGRLDDTMLMYHLYDENTKNGLKDMVRDFFPMYGDYEKELGQYLGTGKKKDYSKIPLLPLAEYAGLDSDLTNRSCTFLESILVQDERVYRVYRNQVMAAFKGIVNLEERGMLIDKDYLHSAIKEVEQLVINQDKKLRAYPQLLNFEREMNDLLVKRKLKELTAKFNIEVDKREAKTEKLEAEYSVKMAANPKKAPKKPIITKSAREVKLIEMLKQLKTGELKLYEGVNFGSAPQMKNLFYTIEGFNFIQVEDKKTGELLTGTGKEVIIDIEDESGFIEDLQVWRSHSKMLNTYLKGINKRLDKYDYVHTSLLQHGTVTGRTSSRSPNLQNIPNLAKLKNLDSIRVVGMIKKCFIVPEGHTLLAIDYSQMELRVMASFAEETTMLQAYADGIDLHALTAATIKGISIGAFYELDKKEQKEYRTRAKAVNFGFIYGMGAESFKEYAKLQYGVILSLKEAEEYRDRFFKLYPKLAEYHATYIAKGQNFGYVRTLLGRKRHLTDIHNTNGVKRSMAEREAINSPIQGTGGEFTVLAGAVLEHRLNPEVKFVLNVHDALYFYVPDHLLNTTISMARLTCENLPTELYFNKTLKGVDIKVDIETSKKSWKDLEPYEEAA